MTLKTIKHLRVSKGTDWLSYQRGIPKALLTKAKLLNIPPNIVKPLKLTKSAPISSIINAIEKQNEKFEDLCRLISATNARDITKGEANKGAKALLNERKIEQGALVNVDSIDDDFTEIIDDAFGIYANQDHPEWNEVYPTAKKLPEALMSAVNELLQTPKGHENFHLFSDAVDHYKAHRNKNIKVSVKSDGQLLKLNRELSKDLKRLDDFIVFSGNQEFTSDNCNVALRRYKEHLLERHKKSPATAKRDLAPSASAMRKYAEEVAMNVTVIAKLTIKEQRSNAKQREVADVETELPLIWAAAHDDSYDQFFRLHVFGIFSGSHASELCQSDVTHVHADQSYFVLGGTKRDHRTRPVVIVNDTHRKLLTEFADAAKDSMGFASICGRRATQTESTHTRLMKRQLLRATGNPKLTAYSLRHTGNHLGDIKGISNLPQFGRMFGWRPVESHIQSDYGKAGIFSNSMIAEYRKLTDKLIEDLPQYNSPAPAAASQSNIININRHS
jgi:integrase